jgi:hypothetical protein
MLKKFASAFVLAMLLVVGLVSMPAASMAAVSAASVDPVLPSVSLLKVPTLPKGVKAPKPTASQKTVPHQIPSSGSGARTLTACGTLPTPCYTYSGYRNTPASAETGVQQGFDIAAPSTDSDNHSLAEMVVEDSGPTTNNAVEFGWIMDTAVCGSATPPCLFVSSWVNGTFTGYNAVSGSDFVQCTTATCGAGTYYTAGQSINSDVGTLKGFVIQWDAPSNAWWAAYNTKWVGYIPKTHWSNASPPVTTFTSFSYYQAFGEIASAYTPGCAHMGNGTQGVLGSGGSPVPTRLASVQFSGPAVLPTMTGFDQSDPTRYNHSFVGTSVRTMYYGGDNTSC